jgi:hypothetical protein
MGNVGSTSSRTGENSPRRSEMTAERVIVDPPFDVQADTASTVADLVSHTQLHCFNELNTVEPETIPPCHDKDQIPIKIELDKSPGTVQGERGEKEFRYLVSRPAECDRTKFRLFRKNLTELFDIGFDRSYSMHGTHRFVIHDEVVKIHNEIYSLMMACGVCSFEQISKLHEAAPGGNSRMLISFAGEPTFRPDTDYSAVVAGAKHIEQQVRKYYICSGGRICKNRFDCVWEIETFLERALRRRESATTIKNQLTRIKAGHLLPVIAAAAERNIKILLLSDNHDHWQCAAQLIAALTRVPDEYLGFDLAGFRSQVQAALEARQATLEALPELQACRRWIEQLGLYISEFEVQQDPDAAAPYVSTRDADDVLHYAWLLGKIEYFEADEILPLLRFVAREAQGETLDHRRALGDEVRNIADALGRFGAHYTKKVAAIRNWMESEPFG